MHASLGLPGVREARSLVLVTCVRPTKFLVALFFRLCFTHFSLGSGTSIRELGPVPWASCMIGNEDRD